MTLLGDEFYMYCEFCQHEWVIYADRINATVKDITCPNCRSVLHLDVPLNPQLGDNYELQRNR